MLTIVLSGLDVDAIAQPSAFVQLHERVDEPPAIIDVGFALMAACGGGPGTCTWTSAGPPFETPSFT
jgi:hypothetical protein